MLAVVVAALGGGFRFYQERQKAREAAASAANVDTHVVGEGAVELVLKETGVVRPRQLVAVKSKVSGKVKDVLVVEGETVTLGQLVAVVEPDAQASLTLSQRRLELRRLKLEMDQREREHRRQSRLAKEGLAAQQVAEEAERDFRSAQNLFLQSLTSLNLLEKEANQKATTEGAAATMADPVGLTDYRILAPMAGIVSSVKVKPGELATSGTTGFSQEGALLMEISDQRQLEVVVNVNEIDVPKLAPGMAAKITLAARPGKPIAAVVDRVAVAPWTDPTRPAEASKVIVYAVALRLPERPPELRQGMTATVDLVLDSRASVLRIPILAFGEKDGKTLVKVKAGTGFTDKEVSLGLRSDRFVEVLSGLSSKDVIASRWPKETGQKP